ncbi:MAG: HD domain-containing protein [Treponema sp.]|jgi:hypothetical protein|nr:HD domain-containing protein [Treponema sp.]
MNIDDIMDAAIAYNGKDARRINHLIKVWAFARCIGRGEHCDSSTQAIVEAAALLHDIGIHEAERKYASSAGAWQEIEGPPAARALLRDAGLDSAMLERILFLIGHHHSYQAICGLDFQILVEADFLVNIFEDNMDNAAIQSIRAKIFKTKTGLKLLEQLYLSGE